MDQALPFTQGRKLADLTLTEIVEVSDRIRVEIGASIPMVLHCPNCTTQHIDEPNPAKGWTNPPHRSHECQQCGAIWRPSDLPTVGVERTLTAGRADTWNPGDLPSAGRLSEPERMADVIGVG